MTKPDFNLIRRAIQLALDKPDKQFHLDYIHSELKGCGTVCCVMGWAAEDPVFQGMGLSVHVSDVWTEVEMHGKGVGYVRAAAELFFITPGDARDLFGAIGMSDYDYIEGDNSHPIFSTNQSKEALLHRARMFFEKHGEPFDIAA